MTLAFGPLDWCVIAAYFAIVGVLGAVLSRKPPTDARDYFLAGGQVPAWVAAVSVLATTQSAATYLGAPDYGYRGDFTYLGASLGALLGALVVAHLLLPRFYASGSGTVYELLGDRYGPGAVRAAGVMFLIGRALAGGSRLYLAAIAVSLIVFSVFTPAGVLAAAAALILAACLLTWRGGLRAIVWIDVFQVFTYAAAATAVLGLLAAKVHAPPTELLRALATNPAGDKLRLFDLSFRLDRPFSLPAILIGLTLLNIGSFGLDQDVTQRLLACKDAGVGARGLYVSVIAAVPVVAVFIAIGVLLYVVYDRPDLMGGQALPKPRAGFGGAEATIFMRFILTTAPPGLKGLAAAGVLATAVGTAMSALNAMSSVLVQDFYRPWRAHRGPPQSADPAGELLAGRLGSGLSALATLGVAALSFYWQRSTNAPLLEFVLSIMTFAYAGLLGVFFAALFTTRGSAASAITALFIGFMVIAALQPGVATALGLPEMLRRLAFPWQLCLGATAAFLVCIAPAGERARPLTRPDG